MSKRIIANLVKANVVRGWDDPRLHTLAALRRRGVPPGAILAFVNELGVTTSLITIQTARFDQGVRRSLDISVPRLMLVLNPVPVVIDNWEELDTETVDVPFAPKNPAMGSHKLPITKTIYIDRSDFRKAEDKDFLRLVPGHNVGLLSAPYPIRATSFSQDTTSGLVAGIHALFDKIKNKPKAYIQWVPEGSQQFEVRIYQHLFRSDNPMVVEAGFLSDVNPNSEAIYPSALIEAGFEKVKEMGPLPYSPSESEVRGSESIRFQAMRVGYFVSVA
jgi:glutaminyl-tRNA synthetase